VTVEIFTKDPHTEILVVLTADCRLLNVRTLPAA